MTLYMNFKMPLCIFIIMFFAEYIKLMLQKGITSKHINDLRQIKNILIIFIKFIMLMWICQAIEIFMRQSYIELLLEGILYTFITFLFLFI